MTRDRMPAIPPEAWSEAQKKAAKDFESLRGRPPFGPYVPLMRSPEAMVRAAALAEQLRYHSSLPSDLNEFLILITARHWTQQYEWHHHVPHALAAGLPQAIVDAVAEGRRPDAMTGDQAIVFDFAAELYRNRAVSDAAYAQALKRFGEQGVMDMTAVCGYYSLLSMVMNVARTATPSGAVAPLPHLPG